MWQTKNDVEKTQHKYFFIGIIIGIAILAIIGIYFLFTPSLHVVTAGCEGIEAFFTNESFWNDAYTIYDSTTINYSIAKSPKDMIATGGDCKSISNTMMCLSKLYDVNCKYYQWLAYDPVRNDTPIEQVYGHLGISCYDERFKRWERLY